LNPSLKVERRGKESGRKLRRQGKVPAVIYGGSPGPGELIAVEERELSALLRDHPSAVVEIAVDGGEPVPALIAEVQRDFLSGRLLHVDFRRINRNEKIRVPVRVELSGESPAERQGGVVQLVLHELEVECLPDDLPSALTVDVGGLEIGDRLTARDLVLPPGVELAEDPEAVVAVALPPQVDAEDAEDAAGSEGAEGAVRE